MQEETVAIWPDSVDIEVLGLTGEVESGKTMFGITIAEPSRTLVYDIEKSSAPYKKLGFKRVCMQDLLKDRGKASWSPKDIYEAWKTHLSNVTPGKWDVIMLDPADDMETGLVESVKSRAEDFGFSSSETFAKSGGIFWGCVATEWKQLLVQLSTKCQTFVFTTHLRTVWSGKTPTSKKEPKGKKTLMELASLYLWMDRSPDKDGNVPVEPRATVLKSRLCDFQRVDGKTVSVPLMPPHLPVATPDEIRKYIVNPPDYSNLKDGERPVSTELSESDRLHLEAQIAQDRKDAAEANATAEERRLEANEALERARSVLKAAPPAAPVEQEKKPAEEEAPQEAKGTEPQAQGITKDEILALMSEADEKGLKDRVSESMRKLLNLGEQENLNVAAIQRLSRQTFTNYETKVREYEAK